MTGKIPESTRDVYGAISSAAQIAYRLLPSRPQATGMFLDPVDVITGLAIVALYDKSGVTGIKLSIQDNRLRRDHQHWHAVQTFKRFYQGSSDEQLVDLIPPIFYGLKLLSPHQNPKLQTLFRLAKDGIEALKKTYESERNYLITTLLHTTHLKLLDNGLNGRDINEDDYQCPSWDGIPLAEQANKLWSGKHIEQVAEISNLFESTLKRESLESLESLQIRDDYNVKVFADLIKVRVDSVVNTYLPGRASSAGHAEINDSAVKDPDIENPE